MSPCNKKLSRSGLLTRPVLLSGCPRSLSNLHKMYSVHPVSPTNLKRPIGRIKFCGEGEIRTPGPRKETPVFKTGALDHSATSPRVHVVHYNGKVASGLTS